MTGIWGGLIGSFKKRLTGTWTKGSTSERLFVRGAEYASSSNFTNKFYIWGLKGTASSPSNNNIITRSVNGTTWTEGTMPTSVRGGLLLYGNDTLIATAGGSTSGTQTSDNAIFTSTNGASWSTYTATSTPQINYDGKFFNGVFFLCGSRAGITFSSNNGQTWSFSAAPRSMGSLDTDGTTWITVPITATGEYYTATDITGGINAFTTRTAPTSEVITSVRFLNGTWFMVQASKTNYFTSTDGLNWTSRTLPLASRIRTKIGYFEGKYFYATTSNFQQPVVLYVSDNGVTWTAEITTGGWDSNTYDDISSSAIAIGDNKVIIAGVSVGFAESSATILGTFS